MKVGSLLHIGFLTTDLTHQHGWGRYSVSLLNALHEKGMKITVIASRNSPTDFPFDVLPLLPVISPAERFVLPKLLAKTPQVRAALVSCDVIHTIIEPFAPLGALVAAGRPHFITGHGTYVALPLIRRFPANRIYRWAFRNATQIICNGTYTRSRLHEAVSGVRSSVVLLGVNAEEQQHDIDNAQPFEKHSLLVLFVAAVKARKGALPLVQAMVKVRQHFPDVQCVLVGNTHAEPHYVARLRQTIDELGLQNTVKLTGHIANKQTLARWYKTADVFVLPSMNNGHQFEGFGLVHLEAGIAGLPVIGTRECGARDSIEEGKTGLLVSQVRIADELPEAIISLLSDPLKRQQMGEAGRMKALHQTWEKVAEQMAALYEGK